MTGLPDDLADIYRELGRIRTMIDDGEYVTREDVLDDVRRVAGDGLIAIEPISHRPVEHP